jgi:Amidase
VKSRSIANKRVRGHGLHMSTIESPEVNLKPACGPQHILSRVVSDVRRHGSRSYLDLLFWISFATPAGLPATTAPIGLTRDGLPVGIQIIGPYLEDATPIGVAGKLADVIGGFRPGRAIEPRARRFSPAAPPARSVRACQHFVLARAIMDESGWSTGKADRSS